MAPITHPHRTIERTIAHGLPVRKPSGRFGRARDTRTLTPSRLLAALAGLALLSGTAGTAATEPTAPGDGTIEATYAWTARDLSTLPAGGGREAFVSETFVVLTASAPAPFERLGGRCIGAGSGDTETLAYESRGSCEYRDADGDAIFERFEERSAGDGSPATGEGTLIGGTGKFAGLSGDFTYSAEFHASVASGVYQGVGSKSGKWHLASPE